MLRQDYIRCHLASGASAVKSVASGLSKSSISSLVASTVSAVLGPDVNPDEPLMANGLDSLGAVELRNSLQAQLPAGLELPATLLFDFPSVNAVSGYIASQVLHLKLPLRWLAKQDCTLLLAFTLHSLQS
jgi:acyl carrier protein